MAVAKKRADKPETEIYVARESFAYDGGVVAVGERVRKGHELLKKYPEYFDAADVDVAYDVEQATAAPGEKRSR